MYGNCQYYLYEQEMGVLRAMVSSYGLVGIVGEDDGEEEGF